MARNVNFTRERLRYELALSLVKLLARSA